MSIEANKAVVRRYWNALWNDKQGEIIEEIAVEPVTFHFPGGQAHQPPNLTKWFETALVAFPDVHFTIDIEMAERDLVATRWSYVATNTGPFLGRPATGKSVVDKGIDIFRLENGKIVEHRGLANEADFMRQLGIVPAQT